MSAMIRLLNDQHLLYFWSAVRIGSLTRRVRRTALAKRKIKHPAAAAMTDNARQLFSQN